MIYFAKVASSYQFFLFEKEEDAIQKCIYIISNYINFNYNTNNSFITANLIFAEKYSEAIKHHNKTCFYDSRVIFGTADDISFKVEPFQFCSKFLEALNNYNKKEIFK